MEDDRRGNLVRVLYNQLQAVSQPSLLSRPELEATLLQGSVK